MTLVKTAPVKLRYVVDLNPFSTKEYKNIYQQFGWELVASMESCYVWRQKYDDVRPEAFSDTENVVKRNQQVIKAITICLSGMVLATITLVVLIGFELSIHNAGNLIPYSSCLVLLLIIDIYLFCIC